MVPRYSEPIPKIGSLPEGEEPFRKVRRTWVGFRGNRNLLQTFDDTKEL